jgi:hypothetical protein
MTIVTQEIGANSRKQLILGKGNPKRSENAYDHLGVHLTSSLGAPNLFLHSFRHRLHN